MKMLEDYDKFVGERVIDKYGNSYIIDGFFLTRRDEKTKFRLVSEDSELDYDKGIVVSSTCLLTDFNFAKNVLPKEKKSWTSFDEELPDAKKYPILILKYKGILDDSLLQYTISNAKFALESYKKWYSHWKPLEEV